MVIIVLIQYLCYCTYLSHPLATTMMIIVFIFALKTYSFPQMKLKPVEPASKQVLLVILCLVLGVELGYKFSSKQVLYLLNPCHVITMVEVCVNIVCPVSLT